MSVLRLFRQYRNREIIPIITHVLIVHFKPDC